MCSGKIVLIVKRLVVAPFSRACEESQEVLELSGGCCSVPGGVHPTPPVNPTLPT